MGGHFFLNVGKGIKGSYRIYVIGGPGIFACKGQNLGAHTTQ